jgi:hypothetical protein
MPHRKCRHREKWETFPSTHEDRPRRVSPPRATGRQVYGGRAGEGPCVSLYLSGHDSESCRRARPEPRAFARNSAR